MTIRPVNGARPRPRGSRAATVVRAVLVALVAAVLVPISAVFTAPPAKALSSSLWNPGNIISDAAMFNGWAMTADQVQAFLNQKVPTCTPGYTCLKDYRQATPSQPADAWCAAYVGSPDERASDIIAKVGMACNVSQKAILVTLQKEQSLVTMTAPPASRFARAMGFGCPDTTPPTCDPAYAGFFYQVYRAARQLQRYSDPTTIYTWYPVGAVTAVRYHPNTACGTSPVFIQNRATAALYYYTPYQPNAPALANLYGTGDACSSYGNRNFWRFYWDWFGSPLGSGLVEVSAVEPGYGPLEGGSPVTIHGSALTGATSVTFGGVAGTALAVVSDSELTVTTPPGTSAAAPVVVTTSAGSSAAANAAFFAYLEDTVVAGTPTRIVDVAAFTPGVVRCYPVTGKASVPVGATGTLLNVTAVGPSRGGYVVVYPDYLNNGASPAPLSSTVNFEARRDVANSALVALPTDGDVCVYSQGGTLGRLILDVAGYVVPGSGITLQNSVRLLDTRPATLAGDVVGPVVPDTVYTVQVTGAAGVPAGATAVVANVTVTEVSVGGHLRMWEADTAVPNTSVVNYAPGQTKANGQIIALSPDGRLSFESFGTSAQVIVDVTGYVTAGSDFRATAPTRIVETRSELGQLGIPSSLVPNTVYPVLLDETLVPLTATAVVLNVTAVNPSAGGNLRVYPDTNGSGTTPPPLASTLNYIPGRAIPNMVVVQIPPGRVIDFYSNQAGGASRTDLIVDVIGYIDNSTL